MPKDTSEAGFQPATTPDSASAGSWQRRHDVIFLLLTLVSLLLLLALFSYTPSDLAWSAAGEGATHNSVGRIGAVIADLLFHGLGYLAFALPLLVMAKLWLLFRKAPRPGGRIWLLRTLGMVLSVSMLCALAEMSIWHGEGLPVGSGGIVGKVIVGGFLPLFSFVGSAIIFTALLALGLMLFLEFSWLQLFDRLGGWLLELRERSIARRQSAQHVSSDAVAVTGDYDDTDDYESSAEQAKAEPVKAPAGKNDKATSVSTNKPGDEVAGFDRFFSRMDAATAAADDDVEPWLGDLDVFSSSDDQVAASNSPAATDLPPRQEKTTAVVTPEPAADTSEIPPWEDTPVKTKAANAEPAEAVIP
ncbi:MAG: cell division protein FtsK, partial [Thalassolituus sp. CG17_big_fil_post_rev_8_21_14_2_50_53_8]